MCSPARELRSSRSDICCRWFTCCGRCATEQVAGDNPWNAVGLEWMTASPPPTFNFDETPVVTWEAYDYEHMPSKEVPVVR